MAFFVATIMYSVPCLAFGEERYAQFPSIGIEVLQPENFEISKNFDGLIDRTTGANVVFTVEPGSIEEAIAEMTPESFRAEGVELISKRRVLIAGQQGALFQVKSVDEDGDWRQWWVIFGDQKVTMVIAQCTGEFEKDLSDLLKRIALSARPIKSGERSPAVTSPRQRQHDAPVALDGSEARKRMESRLKSDTRGPRETIRFGRGAEPKRSPLPVNKTVDSTLPRPQQKLPLYRYSAESVQSTAAIGSEDDRAKAFDERAPEGGILVGAHVITGKNFGGAVSAIGPIFQVGQQYKTLGVHGVAEGEPHVIVAPAGHAVGGVQIRSGLVMDAIRLVYMPVKGRQLDAEKVEYSEWVGGDGGSEREIIGDGSLVVGFGGSVLEDELRTVHLRFVDPDNVRVVSEKRAAPKRDETASPRKWKSANGKFEVEARLESFDGNEAVLIRQDGKKITVASDKLSDADRAFLRRWQRSQAKAEAEPEQE